MLEVENWAIALEVYEGRPISALTLAYQLLAIKQSLRRGRREIPEAITDWILLLIVFIRTPIFTR